MTLNNSPLIILTARRIVKPNSNSDKIKIVSIDRGGAQRRELKIRRSEGKKEKKRKKQKGRKKNNKINACIPCPRNMWSRAKTDQRHASFHSSRREINTYWTSPSTGRIDRWSCVLDTYVRTRGGGWMSRREKERWTDYVGEYRIQIIGYN